MMRTTEKKYRKGKIAKDPKLAIPISALLCVLLSLVLFFSIRALIPVTSFDVKGITRYTTGELAGGAGIKKGDKIYKIDLDDVEQRLLYEFPYIESVSFTRGVFGKLTFDVVEKDPSWYLEISGDYYVLDKDLRVIEEMVREDSLLAGGITKLTLPSVKSAIRGELPSFGEDESEIRGCLEVISAINLSPFKSRLTAVEMESRFDITFYLDHTYEVYIGSYTDLDAKFNALSTVFETDTLVNSEGGRIDVSDPSRVSVKPDRVVPPGDKTETEDSAEAAG